MSESISSGFATEALIDHIIQQIGHAELLHESMLVSFSDNLPANSFKKDITNDHSVIFKPNGDLHVKHKCPDVVTPITNSSSILSPVSGIMGSVEEKKRKTLFSYYMDLLNILMINCTLQPVNEILDITRLHYYMQLVCIVMEHVATLSVSPLTGGKPDHAWKNLVFDRLDEGRWGGCLACTADHRCHPSAGDGAGAADGGTGQEKEPRATDVLSLPCFRCDGHSGTTVGYACSECNYTCCTKCLEVYATGNRTGPSTAAATDSGTDPELEVRAAHVVNGIVFGVMELMMLFKRKVALLRTMHAEAKQAAAARGGKSGIRGGGLSAQARAQAQTNARARAIQTEAKLAEFLKHAQRCAGEVREAAVHALSLVFRVFPQWIITNPGLLKEICTRSLNSLVLYTGCVPALVGLQSQSQIQSQCGCCGQGAAYGIREVQFGILNSVANSLKSVYRYSFPAAVDILAAYGQIFGVESGRLGEGGEPHDDAPRSGAGAVAVAATTAALNLLVDFRGGELLSGPVQVLEEAVSLVAAHMRAHEEASSGESDDGSDTAAGTNERASGAVPGGKAKSDLATSLCTHPSLLLEWVEAAVSVVDTVVDAISSMGACQPTHSVLFGGVLERYGKWGGALACAVLDMRYGAYGTPESGTARSSADLFVRAFPKRSQYRLVVLCSRSLVCLLAALRTVGTAQLTVFAPVLRANSACLLQFTNVALLSGGLLPLLGHPAEVGRRVGTEPSSLAQAFSRKAARSQSTNQFRGEPAASLLFDEEREELCAAIELMSALLCGARNALGVEVEREGLAALLALGCYLYQSAGLGGLGEAASVSSGTVVVRCDQPVVCAGYREAVLAVLEVRLKGMSTVLSSPPPPVEAENGDIVEKLIRLAVAGPSIPAYSYANNGTTAVDMNADELFYHFHHPGVTEDGNNLVNVNRLLQLLMAEYV